MYCTLNKKNLKNYVLTQVSLLFPDGENYDDAILDRAINDALCRTEFCFKYIKLRGYSKNSTAIFSHLHTDQYSQFLYFLSNTYWKLGGNENFCRKILSLNRSLSGTFISYKCKLPDIFLLGHAVGSVIGNAKYNDFLVIFQNVTINTSTDNKGENAPFIGKGVFLAAGATIIGNKPIGNYSSIGVNTLVYNKEIPSRKIVINDSGKVHILDSNRLKAQEFYNIDIEHFSEKMLIHEIDILEQKDENV